MKKTLSIVITVIIMAGCGRPQLDKPAYNNLTSDSFYKEQLDSMYKYTNSFPENTQIAIAQILNGEVSFYGIKRAGDTLFAIQNSASAFEIGSLTKVFTATILANYIITGKIKPEDKINPVFNFQFNENLVFTFQELANHTSGLPRLPSNFMFSALLNKENPYKNYDEKKFDKFLKKDIKLDYPKGSKSEYSNLGMGLLSYSLTKYAGKSFEELLKEMICVKYEMLNSTTVKSNIADILVEGQNDKGKPTANWSPGALIGAGGIYSTVEDLSKFAIAQFDSTNQELTLTRMKTFKENESRDVGLGWFINNRKNVGQWFWHNGGTGGYSSSIIIDVENKNGIIILTNLSSFHRQFGNTDKLAYSLMETLRK